MTAPYKACPKCQAPAVLQAPQCARCGHVFRTQFVPPDQTQMFVGPKKSGWYDGNGPHILGVALSVVCAVISFFWITTARTRADVEHWSWILLLSLAGIAWSAYKLIK
jgi:hypothetical protein